MTTSLRLEQVIKALPERVFQALTDLESWPQWMPTLVRVERLTDGEPTVGSKWREVRRMFGSEAGEVFEVTSLEPGRSPTTDVDGKQGATGRGEYRFVHRVEPDAEGTRLILEGEISGMGLFGGLFMKLFGGMFRKAIQKDLSALKAHLETAG